MAVYLKGRSPIMINSNYYVLDSQKVQLTRVQTARAALILSELLKYQVPSTSCLYVIL